MVTVRAAGRRGRAGASEARLPARSPRLLGWFRAYARRYVARHFHAVRVARDGLPPEGLAGPLLIVLNHPSWWDPLIGLVLTHLFTGRDHFAPIEAASLARYRFLGRLGFFGVEPGTASGARQFLRTSWALLSRSDMALWVTAQGRFADVRERPVRLRPGVGHLAHRAGAGTVLPLALEYPFWDERTPEALARFGAPLDLSARASPGEWTERIATGLERAQDGLAELARGRDPGAFRVLVRGTAGVGGVYDLWRRLKAASLGETFRAEHRPEAEP